PGVAEDRRRRGLGPYCRELKSNFPAHGEVKFRLRLSPWCDAFANGCDGANNCQKRLSFRALRQIRQSMRPLCESHRKSAF
ncbi:hypothetical protein, partial [Mesorhizobium sp.]|uniref:hypothetical protein n=1 Tax=Mesorhizobium sp. TaxID=1871066 RepID=UPI0025BBA1BC